MISGVSRWRLLTALALGCLMFALLLPTTIMAEPAANIRPASVMWGAYIPGAPQDSALDDFESLAGGAPEIIHVYMPWAADGPVPLDRDALEKVAAHHATPLITWEAWGTINGVAPARLSAIASGVFDDYIDQWALAIKSFGTAVFLRPFHEMNNPAYPWSVDQSGNTASDLVRAWQYVHDRFGRLGVDNVSWVWCPNTENDRISFADLYPGDQYVDWLGVDGYNGGTQLNWGGWLSPQQLFDRSYASLSRLNLDKPIMIAETSSVEQGGDRAQWITDLYATTRVSYPRIRAIVWFQADTTSRREADWRIQTSSASVAAFRAAVSY
jgi:beta-mannanase